MSHSMRGKIRLPATGRHSVSDIWNAGRKISGGYGLWGHEVMKTPEAHKVVHSWVTALRALGYPDTDIALYGDWNDARHLADDLYSMRNSPAKMIAYLKKSVSKYHPNPVDVIRQNATDYADKIAGLWEPE